MQIEVTAKHVPLTDALEQYATKKVEKLSRYFDRILRVDVVLDKEKKAFTTEIIVDVEHHDHFVAKNEHEDLYASIDLAVDRTIRQLKDHKSKLRDNKHHTPTGGQPL